jgi:hypothetical protein
MYKRGIDLDTVGTERYAHTHGIAHAGRHDVAHADAHDTVYNFAHAGHTALGTVPDYHLADTRGCAVRAFKCR